MRGDPTLSIPPSPLPGKNLVPQYGKPCGSTPTSTPCLPKCSSGSTKLDQTRPNSSSNPNQKDKRREPSASIPSNPEVKKPPTPHLRPAPAPCCEMRLHDPI